MKFISAPRNYLSLSADLCTGRGRLPFVLRASLPPTFAGMSGKWERLG